MKKELLRDDIYIYTADEGYIFDEDGTNLGTIIFWSKTFPKAINEVKHEINLNKSSE